VKLIRRRGRRQGGSGELGRMIRELDRLKRPGPVRRIDTRRVDAEVNRVVAQIEARGFRAEDADRLDRLVDSYIHELQRQAHEGYVARKNELRMLVARLSSFLARYRHLADHDADKLEHLKLAVNHTLAMLVDPDLPTPNPLPTRKRPR
jgi:hypothetical protein